MPDICETPVIYLRALLLATAVIYLRAQSEKERCCESLL
jgi:hypothetical protein